MSASTMIDPDTPISFCSGCAAVGSMIFGAGRWVADTGSPAQGRELRNAQIISTANSSVTFHLPVPSGRRSLIYSVSARCSAGSSRLTIAEFGATIFSTSDTEIGVTNYTRDWNTPLTVTSGTDIMLGACGIGNIGTLIIQTAIQ
jgi:hypothetical protein